MESYYNKMPPKVFSAFGGYLKSEPSPSFILPLSIA